MPWKTNLTGKMKYPVWRRRAKVYLKPMKKSLLLFRRDLRLTDHPSLNAALSDSDVVVPAFIFDQKQTTTHVYFSANAFRFLLECLHDLNQQLESLGSGLFLKSGKYIEEIKALIKQQQITDVYITRDYTPFARQRDEALQKLCDAMGVVLHRHSGLLLQEVEMTKKADDTPYTVFTPYYKNAQKVGVPESVEIDRSLYKKFIQKNHASKLLETGKEILKTQLQKIEKQPLCPAPFVIGGRVAAVERLSDFIEKHADSYSQGRDIPALAATSGLSAYHKFGVLSPRETYQAVYPIAVQGNDGAQTFLSELHWRDFQTQIGYWFPHVYTHTTDQGQSATSQGANFRSVYDTLQWTNDPALFAAWCDGQTGYPIVDAGMRELNQTGYMHNRLRMIVASFLTKDLHVDWRWGEQYFAQKLIDYDPAVNNGSWQWAASTGCDAQPYFRIFNPWRQQERFDPEALYIKTWLPELQSLTAKEIHKLLAGPHLLASEYPPMIVDHSVQAKKAKEMFVAARGA